MIWDGELLLLRQYASKQRWLEIELHSYMVARKVEVSVIKVIMMTSA